MAETRWESINKVSLWLQKYKLFIDEHINEERPTYAPLHVLWIYIKVVTDLFCLCIATFKIIQDHHVMEVMQW